MDTSDKIIVPVPVAAYRLGYFSRALRMYTELMWQWQGEKAFVWNIQLAIDQLEKVTWILSQQINPNVFSLFQSTIVEIREYTTRLVDRCTDGNLGFKQAQKLNLPKGDNWDNLQHLAALSLADSSSLRPHYDVGKAIAEYEFKLKRFLITDSAYIPYTDIMNLNRLPKIEPLVRTICDLPDEFVVASPRLVIIKNLSKTLKSDEQEVFFKKCFTRLKIDKIYYSKNIDYAAICFLIMMLNRFLQEDLEFTTTDHLSECQATVDGTSLATEHKDIRPSLISYKGEFRLMYGQQVAREIDHRFDKALTIYRAFQAANWVEKISSPYFIPESKYNLSQLADALKAANKGLHLLRFSSSETASRVSWRHTGKS